MFDGWGYVAKDKGSRFGLLEEAVAALEKHERTCPLCCRSRTLWNRCKTRERLSRRVTDLS